MKNNKTIFPEFNEKELLHIKEQKRRISAYGQKIQRPLRQTIQVLVPPATKGFKFKGGNRGQGRISEEWKSQIYRLCDGLSGDQLNFPNILKRIQKQTYESRTEFWDSIDTEEELIFFETKRGELKSLTFKTVKNYLTTLRKKMNKPMK
ncbi:MAG TPA: hypothetical protein PK874_12355 [Desulfobacteraceae bacterium]|nr:hypothetical protein [Desulfobacteraceae bacterium]HPQ28625.1 hypothetical protein [Desulfobacteraceae bacterium]